MTASQQMELINDYEQEDKWLAEVDRVYRIFYSVPVNTSSHSFDTTDFAEYLAEFLGTFDSSAEVLSDQMIAGLREYIALQQDQRTKLSALAVRSGFKPSHVDPVPPQFQRPAPPTRVYFAPGTRPDDREETRQRLIATAARAGVHIDLPPIATLPPPSPASSLSSVHGWETVGKSAKSLASKKSRQQSQTRGAAKPGPGQAGSATLPQLSGPAALSFATVAAAANKVVAPLSKAQLEKMSHVQAVNAANLRFGTSFTTSDVTKEGVISGYLSRTAPQARPRSQPGKIPLHTSEWTIVRSSDVRSIQGPRENAATLVRRIRQEISGLTATNANPELQLLSGRWSSLSSPNFVLVFAGKPEPKLVMKYRHSLTRPFGAGCRLAPQAGYSRIMLNRVHTERRPDGSLVSHAELKDELACNPLWRDVLLLADIRWVVAMNAISKPYSSIVIAFLDEDGSLTKSLLKSPPYMFGECTNAKKYVAMPLLRCCTICHSLCHNSDFCRREKGTIICPVCGGRHSAADHGIACPHRKKHEIAGVCNCAPTCLNCRAARRPCAGHIATDVNCPLHKNFCNPAHRSGDTTDEEAAHLARMLEDLPSPSSPVPTSQPDKRVPDWDAALHPDQPRLD